MAGNKALDRLRREKRRQDKYAEVARMDDAPGRPTRADRAGRGRPAPAGLHLLPPGARAREPGRADPAPARRADRRRDRGGLPGARDDHGAADHPVEAEDQGRATSPTGSRRAQDLPERLAGVLAVLYLVFNEGYLGSSGEALRTDLTGEAIRLTRQLREMVAATPSLGPLPEVDGLLALMLLIESRATARVRDGVLVPLRRAGPHPVGRRDDRRGTPAGARLPGAEPSRALPAAGRDQRRAHRRAGRLDDRLVPGGRSSSTSCWRSRRTRWWP